MKKTWDGSDDLPFNGAEGIIIIIVGENRE